MDTKPVLEVNGGEAASHMPLPSAVRRSRGWGIKEIITTVLFSVLIIVLQMGAASLSMFSIDFALIGSTAVACFIAGPVFMLMTMRVRKFGSTIFLAGLTALIFCLMGNYWYLVPFFLAAGLIVDLILLKPAWRANPNRVVVGWTIYSAIYVSSSILPPLINLEGYIAEATTNRMVGQDYIDAYLYYFSSPEWIIGIVIITAVGGLLGALLGRKMTKKHFAKAGVI